MPPATKYLDEAKARLGSDYAVARAIGVMPSAVSTARRRGRFGYQLARKIAPIIERDVTEMMDEMHQEAQRGSALPSLLAGLSWFMIFAFYGCILCQIPANSPRLKLTPV